MKVIHIIPSAFSYFDDIRSNAFYVVDNLSKIGVETEAITIEFGMTVPTAVREAIGEEAPSQKYQGLAPMSQVMASLDQFDIIHVHCPLFGAAGKILSWKRQHPNRCLVVTYYRRVMIPDFFSLLIVAYNFYYLPRLLAAAEVVITPALRSMPWSLQRRNQRIIEIDESPSFNGVDVTVNPDGEVLSPGEQLAMKYAMVYTTIVN